MRTRREDTRKARHSPHDRSGPRGAVVLLSAVLCGALLVLALPVRGLADAQDVSLSGVWIGHIDQGAQGLSAGDRATEVARRLTELLSDPAVRSSTVVVTVRAAGNDAVISVGRYLVMTVTQADAAPTSVTPLVMAEQWAGRLAQALIRALAVPWVRLDTPESVTTISAAGPAAANAPQSGTPAATPPGTGGAPPQAGASLSSGSPPASTVSPAPSQPSQSPAPQPSPSHAAGASGPSTSASPSGNAGSSGPSQPAAPKGPPSGASGASGPSTSASSSGSAGSTGPSQPAAPKGPPSGASGASGPSTSASPSGSPGSSGPSRPAAGQTGPGGTAGAPAAGVGVSEIQLTPTSDTHVAPGGRVTFTLSFKVQGSLDAVEVTVGWQGLGDQLMYGRFVRISAKQGDNTVRDVWFNLAKDAHPYYTYHVYAVVKVGDTILRSLPVMVIVR